MRKIPYDPDNLQSFEREWLLHQGCNEWWYCTGTLHTDGGLDYAYQFTLIELGSIPLLEPDVLMLALTDLQTGQHHYLQNVRVFKSGVTIEPEGIQFGERAILTKGVEGIHLNLNHKAFALDLRLDYGKGAFWHCDKGKLYMGSEENERNTTLYFSYTNMPTSGVLQLDGQKHVVTGKTWFDKQGGPYNLAARGTNWEWFSLRFHDNEEMMLFTFPHMDYFDGTFIDKAGNSQRLNNYQIKTLKTVEHSGKIWSAGWEVVIPGRKEECYTVMPMFEGNINFAYFEELCSIRNERGEQVGVCFAELLPGVHNESSPRDVVKLLKTVEY